MKALSLLAALTVFALALPACSKPAPTETTPAAAGDAAAVQAALTPYLAIQTALAKDTTDGVAAAARSLVAAAGSMPELAKAAAQLTGADIKADRLAFKPVSDLMAAAVQKHPALSQAHLVVHCSMAPGTWVQKGDDIRNPYYGATMLACGDVKNR